MFYFNSDFEVKVLGKSIFGKVFEVVWRKKLAQKTSVSVVVNKGISEGLRNGQVGSKVDSFDMDRTGMVLKGNQEEWRREDQVHTPSAEILVARQEFSQKAFDLKREGNGKPECLSFKHFKTIKRHFFPDKQFTKSFLSELMATRDRAQTPTPQLPLVI